MTDNDEMLSNIFPEIVYVIDRVCTPSWKIRNSMTNYNIMYIYDGEAEFTCNDKTFIGTRGNFVFYRTGDLRSAHTFAHNPMKCFAVDFKYICPMLLDDKWTMAEGELPFNHLEKIEDPYLNSCLINLFFSLAKLWLNKKDNDITKIRLILIEILTLMIQYKKSKNFTFTYSDSRRVEEITNYILENYSYDLKIKNISDKMQLSPSYVGNIFKRVTGKSIIRYLLEVRISKAKDLLRDGYSVSETAQMVGFNDIFYFSKMFKKFESITPSQFKRDYL